jgi:hypothetical protein
VRSFLLLAIFLVIAVVVIRSMRRGGGSPAGARARVAGDSSDGDAETLRALRDAGADLTVPTEVNFYLYFPTRAAAEQAAVSAGTSELVATVQPAATGDTWLCFVTGTIAPTESNIRSATTRLSALAASLGGEYDGWEAAVAE